MIYEFEQQTPEWFEIRKGKMTGSHADAIGNCGKGLETYISELMAEYYSNADKEIYSNEHTERGIELEDNARDMYELETGNKVNQVGFVEYDEYVGCSPDGIMEDGVLEIKCHDDKKHFNIIINGQKEIPSKYIWQMQMEMLVCNKTWCDYVSFNPNFKKSLVIFRIERDEEKQEALKKGFEIGKKLIEEIKQKYENT